jgi:hypothetical protein
MPPPAPVPAPCGFRDDVALVASAAVGTPVSFSGPNGMFIFRRSQRPAELFAANEFRAAVLLYVPCLSAGARGSAASAANGFSDRDEIFY